MRRATRTVILLTIALLATTVGITVPSAPNAEALTSFIWDRPYPANQRVQGVALSADGSKGFLASTHNSGTNTTAKIWRSTNGGSTWAEADNIPAGSWQAVATDSTGSKVVALGLLRDATHQSIHVSIDGGDTWAVRTPSGSPTLSSSTPSAIDISPDGTTIALATSAGVLISTNGGVDWQTTGIITGVTGVALSTDGSGLLISAFDGAGLRQVRLSGSVVVNAHQPGGINNFAVSDNGQVVLLVASGDPVTTHLSLDGGATWSTSSTIGIGVNGLAPVAVSPDGTRRAVAVYGGGLAESTGASTTWATVTPTGFTTLSWMSLAYSGDGSTLVGGAESSPLARRRNTPAPAVAPGIEFEIDVRGGVITVYGSYFYDITSVTVGGAVATFTVTNSGQLEVTVPAGAVGAVDLVITSAHGSVTASGAVVYRPTPPPRITSWEGDGGDTPGWSSVDVGLEGGIDVYLYGEYFVDVISVTIGGRPVTAYEVDSDSTVVVTLPPGAPGVADLVLTTAHGSTTLSDVIEYHGGAAPTVDSLGQTSGTFRGGSVVRIYGSGLNDTTKVFFGAKSAEFEVISPRLLLADAPSNRIGLMDISITNASGTTVLSDAWNSVWEPYSPKWSPIGPEQVQSGVAPEDVTTVLPDGTGGFYLFGNFENAGELDEADLIVRWTGTAWATVGGDGSGDGRLTSTGEEGVIFGSGVRTAAIDADGRLWVGGAFELDGREVNIARVDPASGAWWAPTVVPDDIVETIEFDGATVIVGGDFGPLSGVPASSRIARLDPATGDWSAIGSDGSGGPAINGNGAIYYDGAQRTVHVVERDGDGSILAGGSFRLSTTTRSHDMLARFDGTTWRTLLSSNGREMVTAVVRGRVDGVDSIVAGVCTLTDSTDSGDGRVVVIPATGPTITLGHFDNCVRDVEIVGDAVVAAGWFRNLEVDDVNESRVNMRSVALYRNGTWAELSDTADIDDLTLFDGDRLAAAMTWQRPLVLSSIGHLVGRTEALSVSGHSVVADGSTLTVNVTGTGFNERTDATIVGRPVTGLEVLSSTRLRFTTTTSNAPRTVNIYGDTASVSLTLSPPTPPPALPSVDTIGSFPTRTLVTPGTVFTPGAPVTVTADGFTVGEEVWIIIASTPRLLGTAIVGSDGLVTATVALPADLLGDHTLVVWSPRTGRGVRQPITISSAVSSTTSRRTSQSVTANKAQLPATGNDGLLPAAVALAFALAGACLVLASRRRSA